MYDSISDWFGKKDASWTPRSLVFLLSLLSYVALGGSRERFLEDASASNFLFLFSCYPMKSFLVKALVCFSSAFDRLTYQSMFVWSNMQCCIAYNIFYTPYQYPISLLIIIYKLIYYPEASLQKPIKNGRRG